MCDPVIKDYISNGKGGQIKVILLTLILSISIFWQLNFTDMIIFF